MIVTNSQILDPFLTVTPLRTFKESKQAYTATGFFAIKNSELFLITCKHVLYDNGKLLDEIVIKLHLDESLKKNYDCRFSLDKQSVILPSDEEVDVAAIKLNRKFYEQFLIHAFSDSNKTSYVTPMQTIAVVGYPLGIFDDAHNLPILRHAMLSSRWETDFKDKPYFLIDARLHEGTSGSPVISIPAGVFPRPTELLIQLLGIHSHEFSLDLPRKYREASLDLNVVWYASILDDML